MPPRSSITGQSAAPRDLAEGRCASHPRSVQQCYWQQCWIALLVAMLAAHSLCSNTSDTVGNTLVTSINHDVGHAAASPVGNIFGSTVSNKCSKILNSSFVYNRGHSFSNGPASNWAAILSASSLSVTVTNFAGNFSRPQSLQQLSCVSNFVGNFVSIFGSSFDSNICSNGGYFRNNLATS